MLIISVIQIYLNPPNSLKDLQKFFFQKLHNKLNWISKYVSSPKINFLIVLMYKGKYNMNTMDQAPSDS